MANAIVEAKKGVASEHPDYCAHQNQWQRSRDAMAGEDAIHTAGPTYLPKLKDESDTDYKARVGRTPFYNASWRTVQALLGMLFRKEPVDDLPEGVKALVKDITQSGLDLGTFAQEIVFEVLAPGRVGILVDHPPAVANPDGSALTVAQAEAKGLRPRFGMYKTEAIFNWQHRLINNKWTLCQVRLMETFCEQGPNEFEQKTGQQIRVLDLTIDTNTYRQRLFRKNTKGEWEQSGSDIVPLMNGQPLDFIPFVMITANGAVADVDDPPLIDLINTNLKHYQVSADYEHACHFTGLPTPWIAGLAPKFDADGREVPTAMYVGSTTAWVFSDHNTKVGYLEFSGGGLTALEKNLASKEAQMAALGARMLAPEKSGVEAADTLAMRHSGEQSILSRIAVSCSQGIAQALTWFCQWTAGSTTEIKYEINRDFLAVQMDGRQLTALLAAWQSGGLSEQEFFELLQRGDIIRSDKSFEDHQSEIETNPPMGVQTSQAQLDMFNNPPEDKSGGSGGGGK